MRRILKILMVVIIAAMLIYIGIFLNNLGKPKSIFSRGIDTIEKKINKYSSLPDDLDLKDKFSIEGDISFELDSEYYKKTTDLEEKKINNLIRNLNNTTTNFKIQKNQSKNTGYMEINSSIKEENILNAKYYINEATKYYFVKNKVDNYINNGSCNYFENINENNTEKDNIEYLYTIITNSLKNNLKEEYFNTKEENDTHVAILKLDDNRIKSILRGILKDLKSDKKSKKLLDNIDKDILKTKIKDEDVYLETEEYYKIYIYSTKILHKPLKYKVEHVNKETIESYVYNGNDKKGNLHYSVNDAPKYDINIVFTDDEIKAKFKNSFDENIGEFKLEKNNYNTIINYTYNENDEKIDLIYSSKYSKVKKNKSFLNKKSLSFKHIVNKETKLSGEVNMNLAVSNKFSILTDITNAKLKTNMTKEEEEKINNLYDDIKNRLER